MKILRNTDGKMVGRTKAELVYCVKPVVKKQKENVIFLTFSCSYTDDLFTAISKPLKQWVIIIGKITGIFFLLFPTGF